MTEMKEKLYPTLPTIENPRQPQILNLLKWETIKVIRID